MLPQITKQLGKWGVGSKTQEKQQRIGPPNTSKMELANNNYKMYKTTKHMKEEIEIIRTKYYVKREGRCSDKMLKAACVGFRHFSFPTRIPLSLLCLTASNRKFNSPTVVWSTRMMVGDIFFI